MTSLSTGGYWDNIRQWKSLESAVQEETVPSHINHSPVTEILAFSCPSLRKSLLKCGLGHKGLLIAAYILTFSSHWGVPRSAVPGPTLINDHNCESMHTESAQEMVDGDNNFHCLSHNQDLFSFSLYRKIKISSISQAA